jgi:2,3-bisphosphoglycerate-independent phosphoglycerate mutase
MSLAPLVLCVLDGWGISKNKSSNAIANANTDFFDFLTNNYPNSIIETSGKAVGLPQGQMGNSEVGHMTIGSGRIILQDLPKITQQLNKKFLNNNPTIIEAVKNLQKNNTSCHIIGLCSDGGIHSHINHALVLVKYLLDKNLKVNFHFICDGRDTPPKSALKYLKKLSKFENNQNFCLATISGRYYAMDRDKRYDRTEIAYKAIALAEGKKFSDPMSIIEQSYKNNIYDEFIQPYVNKSYKGMQKNDTLLFFNFRSDRMRQIVDALCSNNFKAFNTKHLLLHPITMTKYSEEIARYSQILFKNEKVLNHLGQVISSANLKQLRIAETEKYPHVTFFFNAGEEAPLTNEARILIDSPKIATYDLKPEMSAYEITENLIAKTSNNEYDFALVNYANSDMVGHTGNYLATIKAVETINHCLKQLYNFIIEKNNGTLIITADHGNAENMFDKTNNQPHTAHTNNPVPFIIVNKKFKNKDIKIKNGSLADIAPTILNLLRISKPKEMTGNSLIGLIE